MPVDLQHIANLAVTQAVQLTLLIVFVGLIDRLISAKWPRLATTLWALVAVKALTPPVWSSHLGVFSWAQANGVSGESATRDRLLAVNWAGDDPTLATCFVVALAIWVIGAAIVSAWLILQKLRLNRLIQRDALTSDDPLLQYIIGLADRYHLTAPKRVVVSRDELGPAVAGVLSPTLILPASLIENRNPATLRPIVLHELVHTTRRDTLAACMHTLARAIWWFHPLVRWAGKKTDILIERCVDLTVTSDLETSLSEYGRGLLRVLELRASLSPRADLASLRPCQITTERLNYLRDAWTSQAIRSRPPTKFRMGSVARAAVFVLLAVIFLPALPVDALVSRCQPSASGTNAASAETASESGADLLVTS